MITAESNRFFAYVTKTTPRKEALEKRRALFSVLQGREHSSITTLVAAVGGNTKLRAWVSQAIADGEIVRVNGSLRLPDSRDGEPKATDQRRLWGLAMNATLAWIKSFEDVDSPEGKRACAIDRTLSEFYDEEDGIV